MSSESTHTPFEHGHDAAKAPKYALTMQALQGFQFASGVSYEAPHSPTGAAHSDTFKALKALEELEGAKRDALSELASEAAKLPPDERVKLMKEARTAIGAATSLAGIKSAQSNALTAISEAAGQSKLETTLNADEKREAQQREINAMDHHLYETDALYRAETDKISTEAKQDLADADKRQEKLDTLAKENGISTEYDDDVEKLRKRVADANTNGNNVEARRLQAELARLQAMQNEQRIEKAKELGLPDVADQYGKQQPTLDTAAQKALALLKAQEKLYLEAQDRALEKQGLSPEERRAKRVETEHVFKEKDEGLAKRGDISAIEEMKGKRQLDLDNFKKLSVSHKDLIVHASPVAKPEMHAEIDAGALGGLPSLSAVTAPRTEKTASKGVGSA